MQRWRNTLLRLGWFTEIKLMAVVMFYLKKLDRAR